MGKRGVVSWDRKLLQERQDYLRALVLDAAVTYDSIASEFGVDMKAISTYAVRNGIQRMKHVGRNRLHMGSSGSAQTTTLSAVERELQKAVQMEAELRQTIAALQTRRAELQIRYERDGNDVLVWGVSDECCMRATTQEWLRWLNAEGARKLREFITAKGGTK